MTPQSIISSVQVEAEWQQRGLEPLSGHGLRKLRLALALAQPVITPTPVGAGYGDQP